MIDERSFINRVESAGPEEFAAILSTVDRDQERALRAYLGDGPFEQMRNTALELGLLRSAVVAKFGNVVVLHGILGGELSEAAGTGSNKIWANIFRLAFGDFDHLAVDGNGQSIHAIAATGILKKYYGQLLLSLAKSWNVQFLPFDWRLDIRDSADKLKQAIDEWFPKRPVHIVAHSMGGLVARAAIQRHPDMWRDMAPGKLVMLGTPNHGSFAIPLLFSGLNDTINTVAKIDLKHKATDLLQAAKNFGGAWQMLPSLLKMPDAGKLYSAATYANLSAPQRPLDDALKFQNELQPVVDSERMVYVAGYNRITAGGVADFEHLDKLDSYTMTKLGDGTVPHSLGLLEGIPTFFVDEEHSRLPSNTNVLAALNGLLMTGSVAEPDVKNGLIDAIPNDFQDLVRGIGDAVSQPQMREAAALKIAEHQAQADILCDSLRLRSGAVEAEDPLIVTPEERQLQELLFRGMSLDFVTDESAKASQAAAGSSASTGPTRTGRIRVHVICASIGSLAQGNTPKAPDVAQCGNEFPIDAISVGHYIGVKPAYAELDIDRVISGIDPSKENNQLQTTDLIISGFTQRNTLRGELGQPFLIPDPTDHGEGYRRVIAVAGMGSVGTFGIPEAAVLARELCWALSRLGKRHVGTTLIGSGVKNLSIQDAVAGWMQGVQLAIMDCEQNDVPCLQAITFVEKDESRIEPLKQAIATASEALKQQNFFIELCDAPAPASPSKTADVNGGAKDKPAPGQAQVATRITAELRANVFRFGAISAEASFPEREISLNPKLVFEVNDLLAAERDPQKLSKRGEFLRRLLFPRDLENLLTGSAPIVLACDSTLARVHWELLSQPTLQGLTARDDNNFLGLCRGFTRQLRTTFAPPPEPPPPANRRLRVLVVADTASGMPLPGARTEAMAVCQTFQAYKGDDSNTVEVTSMIGPAEANWALVMEKLLETPPYDVMHYAGHCFYDDKVPENSGWIFDKGNVLSARELARVDRIPKFVFSNACESGVTPSRSELRSAALAPSFAEAFFARGVSNFICTAWPVQDNPARDFALRLYQGMLGLAGSPEPLFVAMREARNLIKDKHPGRNWGAYQHYGNPFYQLFR